MEIKSFIQQFLETEAKVLSNDTVPDLNLLNESIEELEKFTQCEITRSIVLEKRTKLLSEAFYREQIHYKVRHLFKLSHYTHLIYGDLWVSFLSYPNPRREATRSSMNQAFIIALIDGAYKIIGAKSVALNEKTLDPVGWEKDMRNPADLNIHDLGAFVSSERYNEPKDDGFSLQDYLVEK